MPTKDLAVDRDFAQPIDQIRTPLSFSIREHSIALHLIRSLISFNAFCSFLNKDYAHILLHLYLSISFISAIINDIFLNFKFQLAAEFGIQKSDVWKLNLYAATLPNLCISTKSISAALEFST